MNNMMIGRYLPLDSFIHKLDPRLKIGSLLILLVSVFFDAGFLGYGILGLFVILLLILSKLKFSQILKAIKPMLFMILFLAVFNLFFIQRGNIVFQFWIIKIYDQAIIQTLYIFIRLVLIISEKDSLRILNVFLPLNQRSLVIVYASVVDTR